MPANGFLVPVEPLDRSIGMKIEFIKSNVSRLAQWPAIGGRNPNFFARRSEWLSFRTPAVQVASESEAAARHTPVRRQRCKVHPPCRPSNTPAQKASPAPAVPA